MDMEWTTVKPKHKRNRSGSSDSEKNRLETSVSPNKKHKSGDENVRKLEKLRLTLDVQLKILKGPLLIRIQF